MFNLNNTLPEESARQPNKHRNITIVLGCMAEKLAGPRSVALFTPGTLDYLISNLVNNTCVLKKFSCLFTFLYSRIHKFIQL